MGTGYKEIVKKNKTGRAEVRVLKGMVKVLYADEDGSIREFPSESVKCKILGGKDLFVSLGKSEDEVISIRPFTGTYLVKFAQFFAMPGEAPKTFIEAGGERTKRDAAGNAVSTFMVPEREVFTALLKIAGGPYDEVLIPHRVPYAVDKDFGSGNFMVAGAPRNARMMREFLEKFGFDFNEDSVPFSSNILPDLEKVLQERDATQFAIVSNGYINKIENPPIGFVPAKKKAGRPRKSKPEAEQAEA